MDQLSVCLPENDISLFWVSPNIAYAIAFLASGVKGWVICLEYQPLILALRQKGGRIFCLEEQLGSEHKIAPNSGKILEHPLTQKFIYLQSKKGQQPAVAFFKPNKKIEVLAQKYNWQLVGNNVELARFFENKITFYRWAREHKLPVLPAKIGFLPDKPPELPVVVQKPFGWAGGGSVLIRSKKEWQTLKARWGKIRVKITPFLAGTTLLNNACLLPNGEVIMSKVACQLTGFPLLTKNSLSTCGRAWGSKLVTPEIEEKIFVLTKKVGSLMAQKGYRGWFGLDLLLTQGGKVYLLECNPRLTASFGFWTLLEKQFLGKSYLFPLHLACFLAPKQLQGYRSQIIGTGIFGIQAVWRAPQSRRYPHYFLSGFYRLQNGRLVFASADIEPKRGGVTFIFPPAGKWVEKNNELVRFYFL